MYFLRILGCASYTGKWRPAGESCPRRGLSAESVLTLKCCWDAVSTCAHNDHPGRPLVPEAGSRCARVESDDPGRQRTGHGRWRAGRLTRSPATRGAALVVDWGVPPGVSPRPEPLPAVRTSGGVQFSGQRAGPNCVAVIATSSSSTWGAWAQRTERLHVRLGGARCLPATHGAARGLRLT